MRSTGKTGEGRSTVATPKWEKPKEEGGVFDFMGKKCSQTE